MLVPDSEMGVSGSILVSACDLQCVVIVGCIFIIVIDSKLAAVVDEPWSSAFTQIGPRLRPGKYHLSTAELCLPILVYLASLFYVGICPK